MSLSIALRWISPSLYSRNPGPSFQAEGVGRAGRAAAAHYDRPVRRAAEEGLPGASGFLRPVHVVSPSTTGDRRLGRWTVGIGVSWAAGSLIFDPPWVGSAAEGHFFRKPRLCPAAERLTHCGSGGLPGGREADSLWVKGSAGQWRGRLTMGQGFCRPVEGLTHCGSGCLPADGGADSLWVRVSARR